MDNQVGSLSRWKVKDQDHISIISHSS